jgi:hypothetical protein
MAKASSADFPDHQIDTLLYFRSYLLRNPTELSVYFDYVQYLKEVDMLTDAQWRQLVADMKAAMVLYAFPAKTTKADADASTAASSSGARSRVSEVDDDDDDDDDDDEGKTMPTIERVQYLQEYYDEKTIHQKLFREFLYEDGAFPHVGIFWALYHACDAAGMLSDAWTFLEIAHSIEQFRADPSKLKSIHLQPPASARDSTKNVQSVYDVRDSVHLTQSIIATYRGGFWPPATANIGHKTKLPIFLVGFYRSGSSLLESMLDAHPNIYGIGEDSVFARNLYKIENRIKNITKTAAETARSAAKSYSADSSSSATAAESLASLQAAVDKHANHVLKAIKARVKESSQRSGVRGKQVTRVVDKMLANYKNIALIHLIYPHAPIIYIYRDPLDVILSCYTQRFGSIGLVFTHSPNALVTEYILHLQIMHHFRQQLPGRIIDVSYEALVLQPESTMRALISRLGLDWNPNVLAHTDTLTQRVTQTASMLQVRKPLHKHAIGRWRKYHKQMEPIIKIMKSQLQHLKESGALPNVSTPEIIMKPSLQSSSSQSEEEADHTNGKNKMNWDLDVYFDYEYMLD